MPVDPALLEKLQEHASYVEGEIRRSSFETVERINVEDSIASEIDLRGIGIKLEFVNFERVDFESCILPRAAYGSRFSSGTMSSVNATRTSFNGSEFVSFSFNSCNLQKAQFVGCSFEAVTFNDCYVKRSSFMDASFRDVRFVRCLIDRASFIGVDIEVLEFVELVDGSSILVDSLGIDQDPVLVSI